MAQAINHFVVSLHITGLASEPDTRQTVRIVNKLRDKSYLTSFQIFVLRDFLRTGIVTRKTFIFVQDFT